jgi:hypothetical protein
MLKVEGGRRKEEGFWKKELLPPYLELWATRSPIPF